MRDARRVVLLGEGTTALSAAWCLRKYPITLICGKREPGLARYSRFVRNTVPLPERSSRHLVCALEDLRAQYGSLLLFPCSDPWIQTVAEDLERARSCGEVLPGSREHLQLTLDKIDFAWRVRDAGLPAPDVYSYAVMPDWRPPVYPVVIKPFATYQLEARVGLKAFLVCDDAAWSSLRQSLVAGGPFLAQQYLEGASVSVCFCTANDSTLAAAYVTEKVNYSTMSTGTRVRSIRCPAALELAAEFTRRLGFVGFGELEMIRTSQGLFLLELNARPWNQAILSEALGVPLLEIAAQLMSGKPVPGAQFEASAGVEWVSWDSDLLYRRAMRKDVRPVRPSPAARSIYAVSPMRDPLAAAAYYLTHSRLGPGRFLKRA